MARRVVVAKAANPVADGLQARRQRRRKLVEDLQGQIDDLVRIQGEPYRVVAYNHREDKWVEHLLPRPDAKALQPLSIAIGIRVGEVLQIIGFDQKGNGAARAAVIELVDRLRTEATG